jgi:hypothetical protein
MEYTLEVWYRTHRDDRDFEIIKVEAENDQEAIEKAQRQVRHSNRIYHNGKRLY